MPKSTTTEPLSERERKLADRGLDMFFLGLSTGIGLTIIVILLALK